MDTKEKQNKRFLKHKRVRSQISGTADRPRLSVFRSNRYLYAQLIDDEKGITLAQASSQDIKGETQKDKAKEVGKEIAKQATGKKIKSAVFDRGGFLYAGKVASVAEGAREGGLVL